MTPQAESEPIPPLAVLLGLAGLIPFLACGLGSVVGNGAVPAGRALLALIDYAAIILGFLGAVHWGLALARPTQSLPPASIPPASPATASPAPTSPGPTFIPALSPTSRSPAAADRLRLAGGVLPALLAWAALLVSVAAEPAIALALLIAGFAATTAVEARATAAGLVPPGYMRLRWGLTLVVVVTLSLVLLLRLAGLAITL